MNNNPIQFATVREDPYIERQIIDEVTAGKVLLIGSGGCTALTLQCLFPDLQISILDMNSAQIDLIKKKVQALASPMSQTKRARFGIEHDSMDGLNTCGNFESLFRGFRNLITDLITTRDDLLSLFSDRGNRQEILARMLASKFWPVAFDLYFSDAMLRAMFGDKAVQHATPGSYPAYFRHALEKGLKSDSASHNYFLHHIFLGHYLDDPTKLPLYLTAGAKKYKFQYILGELRQVPDLADFDVISLSNIFDWMVPDSIRENAHLLTSRVKPGALVVWRQLGYKEDAANYFPEGWTFCREQAAAILASDRSFFYSNLYIAKKN